MKPRWLCASAPAKPTSASATQRQQDRPGAGARGARGAWRLSEKPIATPASVSSRSITSSSTPSWWPAVARCAERDVVGAERVSGEVPAPRPPRRRAPPTISTAAPRRRSGTTQNHSATPERQRHQRAARVGEHQRHQHDAHRGVGERAQQRVAGAARAQPHAADHAHRRGQADRVPVAVRFLQARVGDRRREAGRGTPSSAARRRTRSLAASVSPPSIAGQRSGARRTSATAAPNTPL